MGDVYPQLCERRALIEEITLQEEERFRRTLDRGLQLIADNDEWVERGGVRSLPGKGGVSSLRHLRLSDRSARGHRARARLRGRPEGFRPTARQRLALRSQGSKIGSSAVADVYPSARSGSRCGRVPRVRQRRAPKAKSSRWLQKVALLDELGPGTSGEVITRATPFYPEQGGQVGDRGVIEVDGSRFEVEDTHKPVEGLIVHRGKVASGSFKPGAKVELRVDHEPPECDPPQPQRNPSPALGLAPSRG